MVMGQRIRPVGRRGVTWGATVMAGAALAGSTLMTAPARASTPDCARRNAQRTPGALPLAPAGVYCFGVNVSGRQVQDTYGKYYFTGISLHPALYGEREVVRFYDRKNADYAAFREPPYRGWRFGRQNWTTDISGSVRPGRVCGSLRAAGRVLATVCEAVP